MIFTAYLPLPTYLIAAGKDQKKNAKHPRPRACPPPTHETLSLMTPIRFIPQAQYNFCISPSTIFILLPASDISAQQLVNHRTSSILGLLFILLVFSRL